MFIKKILTKKYLILSLGILLIVYAYFQTGYRTGAHDQAVYIPFINKMLNPETYAHDPLFSTLKDYTTLIWQFLYPLFKLIGIELTLFLSHILSYILLCSGIFLIVKFLTKSWRAGLIAAVCIVFPKITFGTVTITGNYFAPRFLAISISVLAIYFLFKKKYLWTFLFLALATLINLIFASPVVIAAVIFILLDKNIKTVNKIKYFVIYGVIISPLLYLKFFQSQGSSGLLFDPVWVNNVRNLLQVYMKLPDGNSGVMDWIGLIFGIFHTITIFYLLKILNLAKEIKKFIIVLAVVCLALIIATYILWQIFPLVLFFQMQLTRVGYLFPILTTILLVTFIFQSYKKNKEFTSQHFLVLVSTLIGLIPLTFIALFSKNKLINILLTMLLIIPLIFFPVYVLLYWSPIGEFKIEVFPMNNPEIEAQKWMKDNTKIEDLFIIPPYLNEVYIYNFRTYSERSILFSNIELGQVSLSYGFEKSLVERGNDLTKGKFSEALKTNSYGEIFKALFEGFDSLSKEDILKVAEKYGANYLIVEKYKSYDLNLVFENEKYRVYRIL